MTTSGSSAGLFRPFGRLKVECWGLRERTIDRSGVESETFWVLVHRMRRRFATILVLVSALILRAERLPLEPVNWLQMPTEDFFHRPEVNARIDPVALDRGLLAAAIFHQTNRQRHALGLPLFRWLPKAAEAADTQANWAAVVGRSDHRNPIPNLEWPIDRAHAVGLDPTMVGENLATTPIYDIGSATELAIKRDGTRNIYFNPLTGAEAPVHTYASFAAYVVTRWMESPGHRANIVKPEHDYLGCSARPTKGVNGADLLCSAQLFITLRQTSPEDVKVKPRR